MTTKPDYCSHGKLRWYCDACDTPTLLAIRIEELERRIVALENPRVLKVDNMIIDMNKFYNDLADDKERS